MNTLPEKPKEKTLVPIPLILVIVFILIILVWGQLTSVPGKKLTILHTNDLQGQIIPLIEHDGAKQTELGGLARIATVVQEVRNKKEDVLLFDSGDTIQGTLFTRLFGGEYVGELMSKLGYNAVTIGEHDFDKGPDGLRAYIKASSYPFLAANLDIKKDSVLRGLIEPYVVLDVDGINVGVLGLMTEDTNIFANIGEDISVSNPKIAARKVIDELKPKSDIIIVLSHLGLASDKKLAEEVSGIDIIIGGGSKTKLSTPVIINNNKGNNTIIVQANNQGRYVGQLDIAVNDKKVKLIDYKLIKIESSIVPDVDFSAIITNLNDKLKEESEKTIGVTNVPLDGIKSHLRTEETNLGDLFADAVKDKFNEVDIVFQNAGGIRGDGVIGPGKISEATIWEWHPFENKVVLLTLTGKEIKEVLERGVSNLPMSKGNFLQVSGLTYAVDLTEEPQVLTEDNKAIKFQGDRISDVRVNGRPLQYTKNYRVAVNDFLSTGGDGFITFITAKDKDYTPVSLTDVVKAYIEKYSPLDIKTSARIKVKGGLLR
ncbi:MAG: bifunctional UDP-sugar hydrolase/5'-nucleotidase [Vampirovibrionia bacterium]